MYPTKRSSVRRLPSLLRHAFASLVAIALTLSAVTATMRRHG
jgi:hypothetical protein